MTVKICSKCGLECPATTEYFHKNKSGKYGLRSQCKKCISKMYKKYYNTINGHLRCVYATIKQRCNNSKIHNYSCYGGRGIQNKFKSFNDFRDYVINVLKIDPRKLQIDRINNNGNYESGNIQFVTAKENCNNRRRRNVK